MRHRIASALIFLLLAVSHDAWPCSCGGPSATKAQELATQIYTGLVVGIELVPDAFEVRDGESVPGMKVTLKAIRWWKGSPELTATVLHGSVRLRLLVRARRLLPGLRLRE